MEELECLTCTNTKLVKDNDIIHQAIFKPTEKEPIYIEYICYDCINNLWDYTTHHKDFKIGTELQTIDVARIQGEWIKDKILAKELMR